MKCPACNAKLKVMKVGAYEVDVCLDGCGGIWFDENEIKGYDESVEFDIDKDLNERGTFQSPKITTARKCPRCGDEVVLWRRGYGAENPVQVDQCPKCSGIWLDHNELTAIRSQYKTEQERKAVGDKMLGELLSSVVKSLKESA